MILIIDICREPLHSLEFVKPVEKILKKLNTKFKTVHYKKVEKSTVKDVTHIIICGTSLADNDFSKYLEKFEWIKETNANVLGICGGMQLIGLLFNGELSKEREIGFYHENFDEEFLGLEGEQEVYHLHQNYVDFTTLDMFKVYAGKKIPQAVKHKVKEIHGVLFHPEVRNHELIKNFIKKRN